MQLPALPRLNRSIKRFVLWCVLLALPLEGLSVATAQMLGANHFHRGMAMVVSSMEGWTDFRRASHVSDSPRRAQPHVGVQRHHHGFDDVSVVSTEAQIGESPVDAGSGAGSALWLVFAPASGLRVPRADPMRSSWPRPAVAAIQSGDIRRLERPPQA